jgi:O-antigen/teichoic acid export membrane protein
MFQWKKKCTGGNGPMAESVAGSAEPNSGQVVFAKREGEGLKRSSVRGGIVTLGAQAVKFSLQTGSMIVMARLLTPKDFGLQGMVLTLTGFLGLFRDGGLSAATVQRKVITHEQLSTLFWINVGVGFGLAGIAMASAPVLVYFYKEPRLFWITMASGSAFLFNGVAAQYAALLQREMRYSTIAKIDIIGLALASGAGIAMGASGFGYWSLVAIPLTISIVGAVGMWIAVPWRPGKPSRRSGVRSMLHFGGTLTGNQLLVYVGYNIEKVLLGRFWGVEALGLYGRAYQFVNLPLQQLHTSMYAVAFPALAKIQDDRERLCRSFLKAYSVIVSLTIPATMTCALFAGEITGVVLGPKWKETAPILRLLTPTVLCFGIINPFGWLLIATGRAMRSLHIALLILPAVVIGILFGLSHGPRGVAFGYSAAMVLVTAPVIALSIRGTGITAGAYWLAVRKGLGAGVIAGVFGLFLKSIIGNSLSTLPRLVIEFGIVTLVYFFVLIIIMRQKELYIDLYRQLSPRARRGNSPVAPVA